MADKDYNYQITELFEKPTLIGRVVTGAGEGRKLGFPTANLDLDTPSIKYSERVLKNGVYFAKVWIYEDNGKTKTPQTEVWGLLHVGPRSTFGEDIRKYEVYLYDFSADIYGRLLAIRLLHSLRPTVKFNSVAELIEQMDMDKQAGRKLIPN